MTNYEKYRGKCKEMSEALIADDHTLRLVRGYYYEPQWNREEPHWWCVKPCGEIVDPSKKQFPSGGVSEWYTEFDGSVVCEQCGVSGKEADFIPISNYICCSNACCLRLVGL